MVTITMKFTCYGYILYKVEIIFPQSLLYYQHTFPPLYEMQYASLVKLSPEVLELLTCAVFQLVIIHRWRPWSASLRGLKNTEVRGWYMGTTGRMRGCSLYPIFVIASIVC